ncbi:hypothetical protein [Sphingomonas sp. Y38-1Y]|uniref:hypothetical protein n=1 Tax=Sphingomonas sp. Y38-1Y TaxID=3078265 RepID=UPI0028E4BAE1|nr:hypothetical protein [Sphingomonas sp. Y38-1Y]
MRQRFIIMIAAWALGASSTTAQTPSEQKQNGDAIVVEADPEGDLKLEQSIRTGFSTENYKPDQTGRAFEQSERAARCAASATMISPTLLSGVVDGVFNSAAHDRQQDQLFVQTSTCGIGSSAFRRNITTPGSGSSTTEGGVLLRGAVLIAVLQRYAPDLRLDAKTLHEPAVVRRFVAREEPRAKLRIPMDLRYFKVTTCLVQQQPEAAIAIVYGEVGAPDRRMRIARLIDRARGCVGGAKRVGFDPIQFRVYLADSLYRWTVAAKAVETLVPIASGGNLAAR